MAAIVQSFWAGGALSPYERLCIQSFLDHGHDYRLYTYDDTLEPPRGAARLPAADILAADQMFVLTRGVGRGSLSIFADWFRYELLLRDGGWWVDTDVVCLTPDLPDSDLFYAFETPDRVNCAVMKFPADHAVMRICRDEAARLGRNVEWGDTGPHLLTRALADAGLLGAAAPPAACYPIDWTEVPRLFDPAQADALAERTANSSMIHLWNEMLRRAQIKKTVGVPAGSFLDRLFDRHGVSFPERPAYEPGEIVRLDAARMDIAHNLSLIEERDGLRRALDAARRDADDLRLRLDAIRTAPQRDPAARAAAILRKLFGR